MSEDQRTPGEGGGDTQVLTRPKMKRPPLYVVVIHNDDYSTFEFVVTVLLAVFNKTPEEALEFAQTVHKTGKGRAGVYPYDIAQTKLLRVQQLAEIYEMPLRVTIEPEAL